MAAWGRRHARGRGGAPACCVGEEAHAGEARHTGLLRENGREWVLGFCWAPTF